MPAKTLPRCSEVAAAVARKVESTGFAKVRLLCSQQQAAATIKRVADLAKCKTYTLVKRVGMLSIYKLQP